MNCHHLRTPYPNDAYPDQLAELMAKVVLSAANVTSPRDLCWWIQHNSVWAELAWHSETRTSAWGVVLFKLRRLLYDDITELTHFPNFKGAKILAFCLNVMGFELRESELDREMRPLHRAVLAWTKANFAKLHNANHRVAETCLVEGVTYDEPNARLVRTYPAEGLRLKPKYIYLEVEPLHKKSKTERQARSTGKKSRGTPRG